MHARGRLNHILVVHPLHSCFLLALYHSTALHCTALHCITLHCTAVFCWRPPRKLTKFSQLTFLQNFPGFWLQGQGTDCTYFREGERDSFIHEKVNFCFNLKKQFLRSGRTFIAGNIVGNIVSNIADYSAILLT